VRGSGSVGMLVRMSLLNKLLRFSRTRQGRKVTDQAMRYANSPKGRQKIQQVRAQLAKRR
jgi:hypothetical protein